MHNLILVRALSSTVSRYLIRSACTGKCKQASQQPASRWWWWWRRRQYSAWNATATSPYHDSRFSHVFPEPAVVCEKMLLYSCWWPVWMSERRAQTTAVAMVLISRQMRAHSASVMTQIGGGHPCLVVPQHSVAKYAHQNLSLRNRWYIKYTLHLYEKTIQLELSTFDFVELYIVCYKDGKINKLSLQFGNVAICNCYVPAISAWTAQDRTLSV